MLTTEQIAKLPKSVQIEVNTLIMRLDEAKKELARINENTPSNTIVGFTTEIRGTPVHYLKENQAITFCLPNGEIQARIKHDAVEIHSNSFASADLVIRPHVSNVFYIKLI